MAVNLEQELRTAQRKLREAHDEIERLTVDFRGAANKNQELMASNKSHHAEIKRLRAVLEQIRDLRPGYRFPDARDIAREALR